MIGVTVLGATGSIGLSTLDVLKRHQSKFSVVALTANSQVERMIELCKEHRPQFAVMATSEGADKLQALLTRNGLQEIKVLSGVAGLEQVSTEPSVQYVMAAIVGAAGLRPTLAAARAGKRVLLANKEALVMSGKLFMDEVNKHGAALLPIDSEHNAIFQCLPSLGANTLERMGIRKILLTASGGPFRTTPLEKLIHVTPDQACAHPNWRMGRKISVDSATMMNKGLEVIEAHWLFKAQPEKIQVVLHPQSVIHSMVEYADGSVLAQLGNPDMRTPIAHALAWPERIESGVSSLNFFEVARLDFEPVSFERFPCLRLAFEALQRGGTSSCILNAANEIAVEAFLNERILFTNIPKVIERTLEAMAVTEASSIEHVLQVDAEAREIANAQIRALIH